jgi:hypothetical protein
MEERKEWDNKSCGLKFDKLYVTSFSQLKRDECS